MKLRWVEREKPLYDSIHGKFVRNDKVKVLQYWDTVEYNFPVNGRWVDVPLEVEE